MKKLILVQDSNYYHKTIINHSRNCIIPLEGLSGGKIVLIFFKVVKELYGGQGNLKKPERPSEVLHTIFKFKYSICLHARSILLTDLNWNITCFKIS